MLVKLLSATDKNLLLELAMLMALAEQPLLWDGKRKKDITPKTNMDKVSFQEGERERELVADMGGFFSHRGSNSVEARLIKKIMAFPLPKVELSATRMQAATTLLKELLEEKKSEFPSVPKLMLFELMMVALSSGTVSDIELALLKEFQHHYKLENLIFDDLLERAETITKEVSKTISVILE